MYTPVLRPGVRGDLCDFFVLCCFFFLGSTKKKSLPTCFYKKQCSREKVLYGRLYTEVGSELRTPPSPSAGLYTRTSAKSMDVNPEEDDGDGGGGKEGLKKNQQNLVRLRSEF